MTVLFLLSVPISLYCLSMYVKPLEGRRNPRPLLVGILGLTFAASYLHATYSLLFAHLPHPAIVFGIFRGMIGGMWASTLVSIGFKGSVKTILVLSGILFVSSPLALVLLLYLRKISPVVTFHAIFTSARILPLEAWPVGIAIPAVILLLRPDSNGEVPAHAELATENGPEA